MPRSACSGAAAWSWRPDLLGQAEMDGFGGGHPLAPLDRAEPGQGGDDLPDHGRRRGRPGADADRGDPGEPAELDVGGAVDEVGRDADPLRGLYQAEGVG